MLTKFSHIGPMHVCGLKYMAGANIRSTMDLTSGADVGSWSGMLHPTSIKGVGAGELVGVITDTPCVCGTHPTCRVVSTPKYEYDEV